MCHISLEVIQDCLSVLGNVKTSCHPSLAPLWRVRPCFKWSLMQEFSDFSIRCSRTFWLQICKDWFLTLSSVSGLHVFTIRGSDGGRVLQDDILFGFNNTFLGAKGIGGNLAKLVLDFNLLPFPMVLKCCLLNDASHRCQVHSLQQFLTNFAETP